MVPVPRFILQFLDPDFYRFQNTVRLYLLLEKLHEALLGKLYTGVVFGYVDKDQLTER